MGALAKPRPISEVRSAATTSPNPTSAVAASPKSNKSRQEKKMIARVESKVKMDDDSYKSY